jgi:hypothetical protein
MFGKPLPVCDQRVDEQADDGRRHHDDGFRELFEAPQNGCGSDGQRGGDPVGNSRCSTSALTTNFADAISLHSKCVT